MNRVFQSTGSWWWQNDENIYGPYDTEKEIKEAIEFWKIVNSVGVVPTINDEDWGVIREWEEE